LAKRKPTIIDVASVAGVSTATVSRVLNGGPVTRQTRSAVEVAIHQLGYRRNNLARGLVTGRTGVIGVLIPDLVGPLYAEMARGIEDVLEPLGMHAMVVTDNRDLERERSSVELLLTRQVDALIIIGSHLDDKALHELAGNVPVGLIQREAEGSTFSQVEIDNRRGIRKAVAHLIARGHRRLALLAGIRRDGRERRQTFEEILKELGLPSPLIFEGDFSEASGYQVGVDLAAHAEVTAVVCTNDRMALGAYHALKSRGKRIPQDISVIGFDDLPWASYLDPPLTTIRQPGREMGCRAAEQVLRHPQAARTVRILIDPLLIERASVHTVSAEQRR